jgi:hypothetical protein
MSARATLQVARILRRTTADLDAAAVVRTFARALGHQRVRGQFVLETGMSPAAGYPRVRWSNDGTNFQVVRLLALDAAATAAVGAQVYTFDLPVEGAYVAVELQNGVVVGEVSAWAELVPE